MGLRKHVDKAGAPSPTSTSSKDTPGADMPTAAEAVTEKSPTVREGFEKGEDLAATASPE